MTMLPPHLDPAYPAMVSDVLLGVLGLVDQPERLGERLTEELRELTGARGVVLVQWSYDPADTSVRIRGINPERLRASLESGTLAPLGEHLRRLAEPRLWKSDDPSETGTLLRAEGLAFSLALPLAAMGHPFGALLLLGLPEEEHVDSVRPLLTALAPAIALVLRNQDIYLRQEEIIQERTASLRAANDTLLRAERQLREKAALLDITRDAVIVLGLDGVVRFWNPGASSMYGWSAAEAAGKRFAEFGLPQEGEPFEAGLKAALAQGDWRDQMTHRTKAGRELVVQLRITLMRGEAGDPDSFLLVATDVTAWKRLEAQVFHAQRIESLGTLAGGVAHDLNNVLTPIMMAIGMLAPLAQTREDREMIDMVRATTKRGVDVIRQLLLFSRRGALPAKQLDLGAIVGEVHRLLTETFPRDVRIAAHLPEGLWHIHGDATQIHQVLLNLCVNARDAMPDGGSLEITAENVVVDAALASSQLEAHPGRHVRLSVSDTGTGIPRDLVERIFDPFFTTKAPGCGTGLGLSSVLGIVRGHGGFVAVDSEPGKGSTFHVHLPACDAESAPAPADAAPAALNGNGELILLVDDEPSIRRIIERVLRAHRYQVVVAGNGVEAILAIARHGRAVRLMVTDLMMPVMDGVQAIQTIRRTHPDLPVVTLSGHVERQRQLEAEAHNALRFLPKPCSAEDLLRTIRELLAGQA